MVSTINTSGKENGSQKTTMTNLYAQTIIVIPGSNTPTHPHNVPYETVVPSHSVSLQQVQTSTSHSFRMALVILLSLILLTLGFSGADGKCVYAAVGTTKVINLEYMEVLDEALHIRWTHDNQIVYNSKKSAERNRPITSNGSLILENLQLDSRGIYKATVFNALGELIMSTETDLCVLLPVSKPRLTHNCNGTWVILECDVGNTKDVRVTWSVNGDTKPGLTNTILNVTKAALKPEDSYACTARNQASQEKSDDVNPKCPGPGIQMELWLMVAILAGGGGLLLILIVILVIVCRRCRQRKRRLADEDEMRLTPLTQPTRQGSLHHHHEKTKTRPKNRAPPRATPNSRPQAQPRPHQPAPDNAEPIPMPRRTGPRRHKS
ncbi:T-cell surface antigen CD2-like isoform X1 [Esox lucius]|uniref:Ig-like domain-containing protein n=1 Tax=Esox lucius TaxID=8010 RepID=A0A6Q2X1N5_ESOLU|nr:T-cell surface antigen CD2-like isoform X1 [Esox lucius]